MKKIFCASTVFLTIIFFANGQLSNRAKTITKKREVDSVCIEMRAQALKDLKAGRFRLYEFGFVSSPDTNVKILKRNNIELISGGCIISDGVDCYRAIMNKGIRERFKNKILEYSGDGFDRIRFKDEFFYQSNSSLYAENSKIIAKQLSDLDGLTTGKVVMQIFINKFGKPVKINILKGVSGGLGLVLIEKLKKVKFKALVIGNERVNSILMIPITVK